MKFNQIGDRSAKCFSVTIGEHSGKVGAADEGEAIRLFRLHHSIDTTTPPIVEASEFDPEPEPESKKTRAKRTPKADKADTDKAEDSKPDDQQSEGSENDSNEGGAEGGSES